MFWDSAAGDGATSFLLSLLRFEVAAQFRLLSELRGCVAAWRGRPGGEGPREISRAKGTPAPPASSRKFAALDTPHRTTTTNYRHKPHPEKFFNIQIEFDFLNLYVELHATKNRPKAALVHGGR